MALLGMQGQPQGLLGPNAGHIGYIGGQYASPRPQQQAYGQWATQAPMMQQQQAQQQQGGSSIDPMQAFDIYKQISGYGGTIGTGAGGGLSMGGGTTAGGVTGNTMAGMGSYGGMGGGATSSLVGAGSSAGGTGAASGGSSLAAAGPWAALAAAIMANEENSRKMGLRDDNRESRFVDQLSGAVLEQDFNHYGDKVGGVGGQFIKTTGQMGNPEGVLKLIKGLF